jgi:hypothetical protein
MATAIDALVSRPVDLAHAASTDGGNDFVRAEPGSGRHFFGNISGQLSTTVIGAPPPAGSN